MSSLAPDELKALDSTRNRVYQLVNSLASLEHSIQQSSQLPSPESIQAQAFILHKNLESLQKNLTENHALFQRVALHPSTNFPGRTQEHVLQQLLRKKLEPDLEGWVEEARRAALAAGIDPMKLGGSRISNDGADGDIMDDDDETDYRPEEDDDDEAADPRGLLCADVRDALRERIQRYVQVEARDPYTVAERAAGVQNVRTGLRRNLDESDEEDEDESDEDEDDDVLMLDGGDDESGGVASGAGAGTLGSGGEAARTATRGLEPEHVLWFMARGDLNLPPNVELESQRRMRENAKRPAAGR